MEDEWMQRIKGYILAAVSAISYGLIPLFIIPIKRDHFPLNTALFYRFLIASLFLLIIMLFRGERFRICACELFTFVLLGIFYGGGSDLLFVGYDNLSPGIASTIFFVYPVFVVLIMSIFFHEKVNLMTIISLGIIIGGVYILSVEHSSLDIRFFGLIVSMASALCMSLYIITVNKSGLAGSGWQITFYVMLSTAAYFLMKVLINREMILLPDVGSLLNLTAFSLVTTVISVTALTYAIRLIGSTPTSILGALEPVVAVLISVMLFDEQATVQLIVGVLLILAGVILDIVSDNKKKPA